MLPLTYHQLSAVFKTLLVSLVHLQARPLRNGIIDLAVIIDPEIGTQTSEIADVILNLASALRRTTRKDVRMAIVFASPLPASFFDSTASQSDLKTSLNSHLKNRSMDGNGTLAQALRSARDKDLFLDGESAAISVVVILGRVCEVANQRSNVQGDASSNRDRGIVTYAIDFDGKRGCSSGVLASAFGSGLAIYGPGEIDALATNIGDRIKWDPQRVQSVGSSDDVNSNCEWMGKRCCF